MPKFPEFPVTITKGSVSVKIYRTPSKGSDLFTVSYYLNGKRKRPTFASFEAAQEKAKSIAASLAAGQSEALTLRDEDKLVYVRARDVLQPLGVALDSAAVQYAEACKILGKTPLVEAVKYYAAHHSEVAQVKTVSEVSKELLEDRRINKVSEGQLRELESKLNRFSDAFQCPISSVTSPKIQDFLNDLKFSWRTKKNYRQVIGQLFRFAKLRRYIPKDHDGIAEVPRFKGIRENIEIYTPEEMRKLLSAARGKMVAFLSIAAFSGLRHFEIGRLDWSEVRLQSGFIEVSARKSKTASRRLVPIQPNLAEWLRPYAQQIGEIFPRVDMTKHLLKLAKKAGVKWKHNALRHSFISYRLADIQNLPQVALEAGNSPRVIERHYKELVTPQQAKAWFSIAPKKAENVIAMAQTA